MAVFSQVQEASESWFMSYVPACLGHILFLHSSMLAVLESLWVSLELEKMADTIQMYLFYSFKKWGSLSKTWQPQTRQWFSNWGGLQPTSFCKGLPVLLRYWERGKDCDAIPRIMSLREDEGGCFYLFFYTVQAAASSMRCRNNCIALCRLLEA